MTEPTCSTSEDIPDEDAEDFEIIESSFESLCYVSAENYLSLPEEWPNVSRITDLRNAVENCKSMILSKPENSEERKWLVRRLIELRLRMENLKDDGNTGNDLNEKNKVVLGHHFCLQNFPTSTLQFYCDRCSGVIWNIIHSWYLCSDCDYKCHIKCLKNVCRVCAHVLVSENPVYITEICPEPEKGLASQNYRCAECLAHISFTYNGTVSLETIDNLGKILGVYFSALKAQTEGSVTEARLCDYSGKYYCSTCHWNSTSVIPARIILNWDFKERLVSRHSKQILGLMVKLPVLKLEELNPILFACVEELATVKQLRHQLMQIKKYLTSCKAATEEQLFWQSSDKHHFLENEDTYSLQDLIDLHSGGLIEYLNKIQNYLIKHIKVDCEICKGQGFYCEMCTDKKIIFPFEENVMSCSKCQSTFHFSCWVNNNQECPKCNRIQQRLLKSKLEDLNS